MISKKELLYVFPFGFAAWLGGLIFIDRRTPEKARETMNQAAEEIVKKKVCLQFQAISGDA